MTGKRNKPEFQDYHRTIIGDHGTKRSTALEIIQGFREFEPSKNRDDWLGNGIYFWEHGPQQAWWWAERRREQKNDSGDRKPDEEIAVLASMIRLGRCLDLLDPSVIQEIREFHAVFVKDQLSTGKPAIENAHTHRYLDCAVFEYAYGYLEEQGRAIDTCRAAYVPTNSKKRIWKGSWIYEGTHLQICVRNPKCILGTWLVKPQ